ncbi:hypothetical protein FGG08_003187 [Glutinoglossum americanum]|uniref:Sld7 C-terminal domain-containing protein n=1 Tax=Glutinoglossum americanum TaxID=1670608 RepID=A0A9P8L4Z8_9PEZI|nr:hypothetical protein FGG08_003187 [Glutinoglossum americanum]
MTRSRQVWSGDIALDNCSTSLQGKRVLLPQNAELTFLSYVAPSRIPLHLVASPSLDVWTGSEATESWFHNFFLNCSGAYECDGGGDESTAWYNTHQGQPDIGVLLRVGDGEDLDSRAPCPKITEVLLYGILSEVENAGQLPTPPASSSPAPLAAADRDSTSDVPATAVVKQLKIYALLLSSELAYSEAQTATTTRLSAGIPTAAEAIPDAPGEPGVIDAQFLPPLFHPRHRTQPPLKRRRAETLFEDATEKVRKARRSGGEGISQAMADVAGSGYASFPPVIKKAETRSLGPELLDDPGRNLANSGRSSREGSVGTKPHSSDSGRNWSSRSGSPYPLNVARSKEGKETDQIRTASRRNTLNDTKRSSLSLFSSTVTGDGEYQISQTVVLEPLDLPEAQKTIEMRNKESLSRIVMAGMRIYGLQQQKKANRLRDASEGPISIDNHTPLEIDEYKHVYHQTFKGACFAFRRHIAATPLKHDCMRDVVDKLLAVFCSDPLVVNKSEDGNTPAAFGQDGAEKSPFAPESGQRRSKTTSSGNAEISTPRVRRRFADRSGGEPPLTLLSAVGAESPLMKRNASVAGNMAAVAPLHQETLKRQSI